ncbi:hypothetical protein [Pararhodobacter sp.]|uniref:hypothetical protein n=1 Tax=Pararhodobacter sp. TaxID=2127056 RepID=UPI002AFE7A69|nr:hypothetical protein [Pararhodobacter sp.]
MANASLAGDLVSDDTGFRMTLGDDLVRDTPKPHIRAWIKVFGAHLFMVRYCWVIIDDGNTLRRSLLTALSAPPGCVENPAAGHGGLADRLGTAGLSIRSRLRRQDS